MTELSRLHAHVESYLSNLQPPHLVMLYGMMERAYCRVLYNRRPEEVSYEVWSGLLQDLNILASNAYQALMAYTLPMYNVDRYVMGMPMKEEWRADKPRVSD